MKQQAMQKLNGKKRDHAYVAFCIAFIADAPVLNASTVSVVAFAPSNVIICLIDIHGSITNLNRFSQYDCKN
uniref:Uncharacterized protein n=1 Tax=Rhizophora mucronata TaxID=61149 RepID=A0A2P2LU20_RHIMU